MKARCNNDCRQCYIALPAGDAVARSHELAITEISAIAEHAVELGVVQYLITGGEPFIRPDFLNICTYAKKNGYDS